MSFLLLVVSKEELMITHLRWMQITSKLRRKGCVLRLRARENDHCAHVAEI